MKSTTVILTIGLLIVFLAIISVLMLGSDLFEKSRPVSGVGIIVRIAVGDGFWGLLSEDGGKYRLINLDPIFAQDGLVVDFQGMTVVRPKDKIDWGQAVTLTYVVERPIELDAEEVEEE